MSGNPFVAGANAIAVERMLKSRTLLVEAGIERDGNTIDAEVKIGAKAVSKRLLTGINSVGIIEKTSQGDIPRHLEWLGFFDIAQILRPCRKVE